MDIFSKVVDGLVTGVIKIIEHPVALLMVLFGSLASAFYYPEYRYISIPLAVACACGLIIKVIIIISRCIRRLLPNYERQSWPRPDIYHVIARDEFKWGALKWELRQMLHSSMSAYFAKCEKCNVKTHCYEDYKKTKIKIKCPNCGFSKSYKGTVASILEYVTHQYNENKH